MASLSVKAIINSALSKAEVIGLNLFFSKTNTHRHTDTRTHTHAHKQGYSLLCYTGVLTLSTI